MPQPVVVHAIAEDHLERIARAAHSVNRTFCIALGDHSIPPWDEAPEWQKDSIFAGIGGVMMHPDLTPEQSHELWLKHKLAEGWTFGPRKDPVAKTHPCMLHYSELPIAQRAKDQLFITVVRALL